MIHDRHPLSREQLSLEAIYRRKGRACPVRLTDISSTGCQAEIGEEPAVVGERVILKLNDHVSLTATVQWSGFGEAGLSFANPLHGALLLQYALSAARA